jgi:carbonic anhydrase
MRFPALAALLLCVTTIRRRAIRRLTSTAPWDYEGKRGALTWGKLDPAYKACSVGTSNRPSTFAARA